MAERDQKSLAQHLGAAGALEPWQILCSSPGRWDLGCGSGNIAFSSESRIFKPLELLEGAFGGLEELPGVCGRITDTPMTSGLTAKQIYRLL